MKWVPRWHEIAEFIWTIVSFYIVSCCRLLMVSQPESVPFVVIAVCGYFSSTLRCILVVVVWWERVSEHCCWSIRHFVASFVYPFCAYVFIANGVIYIRWPWTMDIYTHPHLPTTLATSISMHQANELNETTSKFTCCQLSFALSFAPIHQKSIQFQCRIFLLRKTSRISKCFLYAKPYIHCRRQQ